MNNTIILFSTYELRFLGKINTYILFIENKYKICSNGYLKNGGNEISCEVCKFYNRYEQLVAYAAP
jgi:hypothetical protein